MLLLCVESDLIVLGLSLRQTSLSRGGRRELPDGPTKTPGLSFCLLHDLLCIYLPALLSVCLTANLCQPVLSIWPTLSCITNNHCHPPSLSHVVTGPPSPRVSFWNIFLPISPRIIFSCLPRNKNSWLSFILLIHRVAEANLGGDQAEAVC